MLITKSIKLEDDLVEDIETVAKGLNEKSGFDLYDFSNVVRVALNQYLNSAEIKTIIQLKKDNKEILSASESSLSKDWLNERENAAWANL